MKRSTLGVWGTALTMLVSATCANAQVERADPREGIFSSEVIYDSKFVEVAGSRMHYVEGGEGQAFLFLHGNPTSSYLWRNIMPLVEAKGRVIAPDLVGFGKSDKPEIDYTLQSHQAFVDGFIEALDLKDIVLVIHDWGSMLGLDYARRHADNVKAIAMMEAIIPPTFPMESLDAMGPAADLFRQFRNPETGRPLLIDQNAFVEQLLLNAPVTRELADEEKNVYRAPFTDPKSREPIYVWPNELPIEGKPQRNVEAVQKVGAWLRDSETPKLLLYARPGALVPPPAADWMQANYRNLEAVFVGYGTHYIQEDNPESIGRNIVNWYNRTFPR